MRRLRPGCSLPLSEDFARWRDDPMTRMVFKALDAASDAQKQAWEDASWNGGRVRADELKDLLQELRIRSDCYRALGELTIDDIKQWLGIPDEQ
jgi:hypothetical protein